MTVRSRGAAFWLLLALTAAPPALAQDAEAPAPRGARLPAATVVTAAVARLTETVPVNGSLVARETVAVMPQVTGYQVVEVAADVGDTVAKGAVLVRLDSAPLEAQLKQTDAEIAAARATIAQNASQIEGQQATLTQATSSLERARKLLASGAGAQSRLDEAEATFAGATASLQAARDALNTASAQLEQIRARREELALQRARTDVVAPVAGVIATRSANVGQNAGMDATAMFTIIENGEIEFDGQIIETALGQVKPGQAARLRLSGFEERRGSVRLLSPNVDPKTRLGSVRITIDDDRGLPIGIFASAVITTDARDAVTVPLSAVVPSTAGNTIQVVGDDGVIEVRKVATGIVENDLIEIATGLSAGETVVAKSGPFFRDGMKIRPVTQPSAGAGAPATEEVAGGDLAAGAGKAVAR
jgi:HlyD family secretion protein